MPQFYRPEYRPQYITRVVGAIDERLPYKEFVEETQRQVKAMPLEIIENGVRYRAEKFKTDIEGCLNIVRVVYRAQAGEA